MQSDCKTAKAYKTSPVPRSSLAGWLKRGRTKENIELYAIMLPLLVLVFVFCYIPIYGLVIAFQDYTPGIPMLGEGVKWVGLKHITKFITGPYFGRLMSNTLLLSLYNIIFGFWPPIVFALLLNEVRMDRFKKVSQTVSYLPYFISAVVVAGMVKSFIRPDGIVNQIIMLFGGTASDLNMSASAFPVVYTLTNIWKNFGFNSILYMSTMSSIDPALYESAGLDGANRFQKIWHITIPNMLPVIAVMLVMAVGGVMNSNTDLILLLYGPSTYIYRDGILNGHFSFNAAVGLFSSLINFLLVFGANKISNRLTNYGLW